MTDSASGFESESDSNSVDISGNDGTVAHVLRRLESLKQENRVLKTEVETQKLKIKDLNAMNHQLRQNSVNIQAMAEQGEEYISNTLLKRITELKKEKESLAINYEQEEECLTNALNRKFTQLRQEKGALERTLAREQEDQVNKLKSRIEKLQKDLHNMQTNLDRLRREKVELENALEQEQESLVNRLWKKMEKLEAEKRMLQEKIESFGSSVSISSSNQSLASGNQLNLTADSSFHSCGTTNQHHSSAAGAASDRPTTATALHGHMMTLHTTTTTNSSPMSGSYQSLFPSANAAMSGSTPVRESAQQQLKGVFPVGASAAASGVTDPVSLLSMDVDGGSVAYRVHGSPSAEHTSQSNTSAMTPTTTTVTTRPAAGKPATVATMMSVPVSEEEEEEDAAAAAVMLTSAVAAPSNVKRLREEVLRLRRLLDRHEAEHAKQVPLYKFKERSAEEENRRLRKMLQLETERRQALSRQLSESESSLEMEDERQFNEACRNPRFRTASYTNSFPPVTASWVASQSASASQGPGHVFAAAVAANLNAPRCHECGQPVPFDDWSTPPGSALMSSGSVGRHNPLQTNVNSTSFPGSFGHQSGPESARQSSRLFEGEGGSIAFAKPSASRMSAYGSLESDPMDDKESYMNKRLSSYSSNDQLVADGRPPLSGSQSISLDGDDDDDDDDEDARCVTPPVCHPDFPKH